MQIQKVLGVAIKAIVLVGALTIGALSAAPMAHDQEAVPSFIMSVFR